MWLVGETYPIYGLIWFNIWDSYRIHIDAGWWEKPSPLKNHGVKVSWHDYSIPNIIYMGK